MRTVDSRPTRSIWKAGAGPALVILACLYPLPAGAQEPTGFQLRLDKSEYNVGETITMTTTFPADFRPSWHGWFAVPLEKSGAGQQISCEWEPAMNGTPCKFKAPHLNGRYEVQFTETGGGTRIFASVPITVQSKPTPGAIEIAPVNVAIGEVFDIELNFPGNRYYAPNANWSGPSLRLFEIKKPEQTWAEKEIELEWLEAVSVGEVPENGGRVNVTMKAPKEPCVCELRLYDRYPHDLGDRPAGYLLAVRPLALVVGNVPGAIEIDSETFSVGHPIDLTVNLPPNRYYNAHWWGPNVKLIPKKLNGKTLTEEEAQKAFKECGDACWTILGSLAAGPKQPRIAEYGIVPGRYTPKPITAPARPGVYELRLYGDSSEAAHAFARRVITIEPVSPRVVRFVRRTSAGLVELPSLNPGDKYQLHAIYEFPQRGNETVARLKFEGELEGLPPQYVPLTAISDTEFLSEELVVPQP